MYIDKSLCLLYTLCRIILKRGVKFMDKSIRDLEFELYDYNSPQRLDYLRDDNFMISQHILDKERDKILTVLHSHHYYEIEILLYGKVIEVVNGEETVSEPGGFVFVSPNDIHTCEFIEDKAVFLVIKIKLEIFSEKLQKMLQIINFPVRGRFSKEEYEYIGMSVENMQKVQERVKDKEIFKDMAYKMLEALVLFIIGKCDDVIVCGEYTTGRNSGMMDAIIYVRENYNKNITMGEVAKKFGYAYNYFGNRFKKLTGKTFVDYINNIRLINAYSKVVLSDDSLEKICEEVGYSNFSYFYRKFKNKYGCTPGSLRK